MATITLDTHRRPRRRETRSGARYRPMTWLLGVVVAAVSILGAPAVAAANFGPHAPTATDTDTCAMCHRAHSSYSEVGWTDSLGTEHSALFVGAFTTVTDYCLVCHGVDVPGAATNVIAGIFEGTSAYPTSSTPDAPLNAGGFGSMPDPYAWTASGVVSDAAATSRHDLVSGPLPLWAATGGPLQSMDQMTCISCHEPHTTSNFRMLRSNLGSVTVGGYTGPDGSTPNAFVFSTETGFPIPGADPLNPEGGFLQGAAGAQQVAEYRPNYTDGTPILNITSTEASKSLSVWCAGCHAGYRQTSAVATVSADFGEYEANLVTGEQVGALDRHFHPVDVTMERGYGPDRTLPATVEPDPAWIPMESALGGTGEFYKDYIGCLTCHRAHGTSVSMGGWAASHLETNPAGYWMPVQDTTPGIPPAKATATSPEAVGSSALLRTNNRGVCERCHGG